MSAQTDWMSKRIPGGVRVLRRFTVIQESTNNRPPVVQEEIVLESVPAAVRAFEREFGP